MIQPPCKEGAAIEQRSMEIIAAELEKRRGGQAACTKLNPEEEAVLKRVIHASADFDFAETLIFTHDAASAGAKLLKSGCIIVTDTNMALAGINKKTLEHYGGAAHCFIAHDDVIEIANNRHTTRAAAAVDKAAAFCKQDSRPYIFAAGNAPTALIRLHELIQKNELEPALIIACPVGFVNVVESKERIRELSVPAIITVGNKGGSPIAAAIINALLQLP